MGLSWEDGFTFFYCGPPYSNLAGIKNFDPYGVVPVSYTPDEHRGCNQVRRYNVQGRQATPVSERREARTLKP